MTMRHPTMREILVGPSERGGFETARPIQHAEPVIAVSRQPGSRGRDLALALGRSLTLDVFDREILHRIARSSEVSEQAVAFLDERPRSVLTDWLRSIERDAYLSPYSYFDHLVRVVRAIAHSGGAVILGRGAHLILRPGEALRVLVVAPRDRRIATVAERDGVSGREAERRIQTAEAERDAFLRRYFHADPGDETAFDVVVNTAVLGVDGALDAVRGALARIPERRRA